MSPIEMVEQIDKMNDDEFRLHTLTILQRELGLHGYLRFLRVYRAGAGDYTQDRHKWLDGLTLEEAMQDVPVS